MRKSLHRLFTLGLIAWSLTGISEKSDAQQKIEWGNPDMKYVEKTGWSLGLNFGTTDLWGDVGTKSIKDHYTNGKYFDKMRFMGGAYGRYCFMPGLAVRGGVNYGSVYATDAWNKKAALKASDFYSDAVQRYVRNLDVYSVIWEGNIMLEISPLDMMSNWEFAQFSRFQPYILIGVGGFHFNPRGTYEDPKNNYSKVVDLRELHTEGEGFNYSGAPKNYNLWAFQIPVGIGFRFDIGKSLGLGLDYTVRYTFTDYLDDVSGKYVDPLRQDIAFLNDAQGRASLAKAMSDKSSLIIPGTKQTPGTYRGDPNNKDMYGTLSVNFFWRIHKRTSAWWK